jgi:hypothetical protein
MPHLAVEEAIRYFIVPFAVSAAARWSGKSSFTMALSDLVQPV